MPDTSNAQTTALTPSVIARLAQIARYIINGVPPDTWMSPMQPLRPIEGQGAIGRQWDYPVGYNLDTRPRGYAAVTFEELRALAQNCDLVRLAIETRKDQIEALGWSVRPRTLRKAPAGSRAATSGEPDPRALMIEEFLRYPDRQNDWNQWLRALLEDLFVTDAASLYRRRDRAGRLYALQLIDGATLKPLIDEAGLRPVPPDPAFEQILKGVPKNLYTSEELLYLPRNIRTWSVYGYSPVEQIILTVNIALRRSASQLQYYTDGNMPDALVGLPEEWTSEQILAFQREWDAMLAGNLAMRRKGFFVPGEFKYQPLREAPLKDDFDEWLARIVCYAFSLSPTPFVKQTNRGTAESAHDQALEEGLTPLLAWVKRAIDRVIREDFGAPDLEFIWADDRAQDPAQAAAIDVNYVKAGIKSVDEVRAALGLDPMGGAASRPMLATPQGYVPLAGLAAGEPQPGTGQAESGAAEHDRSEDDNGPEDDGPKPGGHKPDGPRPGGSKPKARPATPSTAPAPSSAAPQEENNPFGSLAAGTTRAARASRKGNPNHDPSNGQFTGPGGGNSSARSTNDDSSIEHANAILEQARRDSITNLAIDAVGSRAWTDDSTNENFSPGDNKCNLFVYQILTAAGASPGLPNGQYGHYPPTAGQWADPTYTIPGWYPLSPDETPMPGDVVAQRINYGDSATGHVMIVGPENTVIGTGDSTDGPPGTIEMIPMPKALGPRPLAPMVFRRWHEK